MIKVGLLFSICTSKNYFVSKKIGNQKNKAHFYHISFKSCLLGGLSLFDFQQDAWLDPDI